MPDAPLHFTEPSEARWYCVGTRSKSEHIAAANLNQIDEVEVFCPRLRYKKVTRRGKIWFHEALFPCYVFAKFVPETHIRAVRYAGAVTKILQFGQMIPALPDEVIEAIRAEVDENSLKELPENLEVGDEVMVAEGPMVGLTGVVTHKLSGSDRVRVLLEFLGQNNMVEASAKKVGSTANPREDFA